jgi:hypothetical protein
VISKKRRGFILLALSNPSFICLLTTPKEFDDSQGTVRQFVCSLTRTPFRIETHTHPHLQFGAILWCAALFAVGSQFIRGVAELLDNREDKLACLLGTENPLNTALKVRFYTRCGVRKALCQSLSERLSGGLAWQLSYAFEQTAEPIKMKDFAAYKRLMRGAMEFDEVRARDRHRKCFLQPSFWHT